jgi:hypothetical protein
MSTNAALCEEQLALGQAQADALEDATIKQNRWDVKKGQMEAEIATIKSKWETAKANAGQTKTTDWTSTSIFNDQGQFNRICQQKFGNEYSYAEMQTSTWNDRTCCRQDCVGGDCFLGICSSRSCWCGMEGSPCGCGTTYNDCKKMICRNPASWYEAQSNAEVEQKKAQYNMPGRPSLPVSTLNIACQICGQSMNICNVTKSDGTPDVIASNSCLATKISQNQTCNLNVGGGSPSSSTTAAPSTATTPVSPNISAPVVASTTTPMLAPTPTPDDKQKMLLIGGGIGLGVILLIIILLMMSS